MAIVYFGLGSNLGQKENFLRLAILEIEKQIGHIMARSAFFESAPWGFDSPHSFINACVAVETTLNPHECLYATKDIERRLGRAEKTSEGYKDRVIDIDILFYEQLLIEEENLTIPHPLLHQRLFVLNPLAEIAPNLIHPLFHKSIEILLKEIS
ncbi:MAG: 2-amino-4-hydroxy-6-hydroxymethyldihydropteridine diphosphokinase [Bacteroidales bacterium]|nr:2-amino-4-hydroxy-6-hydroxymethyldihydropteridine diphosphokinase [Bacteroidales bacterium]